MKVRPIFRHARRTLRLAALLLALLLALPLAACMPRRAPQKSGRATPTAIVPAPAPTPMLKAGPLSPDELSEYRILVTLDPETMTLSCQQMVRYIFQGDAPTGELVFHIYPNAFQNEDTAPFEKGMMWQAYPNGFSPGGLTVEEVSVNQHPADFSVGGEDGTLLSIPLASPISKGDSRIIEMVYTVLLPESHGRFGYGSHTINACNWYPIAAVFEHGDWRRDPYGANADPSYSDMADYQVIIDAPDGYVVASSGTLNKQSGGNGRTIWTAEAPSVRDFTFFASQGFQTATRITQNGVTVTSYHWAQDGGKRALDTAVYALDYFSRVYGPYPYPTFRVVQSDFFIGGMEYPNIVQISANLYSPGREEVLELVVAHEVAHQWWYHLVGSDSFNQPWLDEALTDYSAYLYFGERYGEDVGERVYNRYAAGKYLARAGRWMDSGERINLPAADYASLTVYDALVYGKGSMMMHALRKELGDDAFFAALSQYFYDNRFTNATPRDLLDALKKATGKDYTDWLDAWLSGRAVISGT